MPTTIDLPPVPLDTLELLGARDRGVRAWEVTARRRAVCALEIMSGLQRSTRPDIARSAPESPDNRRSVAAEQHDNARPVTRPGGSTSTRLSADRGLAARFRDALRVPGRAGRGPARGDRSELAGVVAVVVLDRRARAARRFRCGRRKSHSSSLRPYLTTLTCAHAVPRTRWRRDTTPVPSKRRTSTSSRSSRTPPGSAGLPPPTATGATTR